MRVKEMALIGQINPFNSQTKGNDHKDKAGNLQSSMEREPMTVSKVARDHNGDWREQQKS